MKPKILAIIFCFLLIIQSVFADDPVVLTWDSGTNQHGSSVVTNYSASATDYYFSITTPASVSADQVWRVVLELEEGEANIYAKKMVLPTPTSNTYKSERVGNDSIVQNLRAGETWYILVKASAGAKWKLFAGDLHIETLSWDDARLENGSSLFEKTAAISGDYYFKITTEEQELGAWRAVLNVPEGEANLYVQEDKAPVLNSAGTSFDYSSDRTGADGVVMPLSTSTGVGKEYYILVQSLETNSDWNVFAGDLFVKDLGALTYDTGSCGSLDTIPAEGLRFYKTTIPVDTYGWRLWLRDGSNAATKTNAVYVRKGLAPLPDSTSFYDRTFRKQDLLVLDYIEAGSSVPFLVSIEGTPGEEIRLDSRKQAVEDISYGSSLSAVSVEGFLYKTYRVPVPSDLLAWEVVVSPTLGNPDLALGFDGIPSPNFNDAFSEFQTATLSESITIVPPALKDGASYITVYGKTDFTFDLKNGEPTVTPIDFISETTNSDTNRVGWQFFSITDIDSQKGYLGWLLTLANQTPGTQISIQRNQLPGAWKYRTSETSEQELIYNYKSSTYGYLQDPAHQADVWYVGIYSPSAALGNFTLKSSIIVPEEITAFNEVQRSVTNLPPQAWVFYHITIPEGDYLGWNVRVTDSAGGIPNLVIRADNLPDSLKTTSGSDAWGDGSSPEVGTAWASGSMWATLEGDWSGYDSMPSSPACMITAAKNRPLTPGSYYIGFFNDQAEHFIDFTFESNPIQKDVPELAYEGGEITISNLVARHVAYFKVKVPTNTPSWKVWLENVTGESSLYIRRDYIPTWKQKGSGTYSPDLMLNKKIDSTMVRLQKPGDEYYVLLPENFPTENNSFMDVITPTQDHVDMGALTGSFTNDSFYTSAPASNGYYTYYLMVVSEGVGANQANNTLGTGEITAILHSEGTVEEYEMGEVLMGSSTVSVHDSFNGGESKFYTFTENGIGWIKVDLNPQIGTPSFLYRWRVYPETSGGYGGYFSGYSLDYRKDHKDLPRNRYNGHIVITDLRSSLEVAPAEYDLTLSRWPSEDLVADGGTVSVTNAGTIVYKVVIPDEVNGEPVLGWELKIKDWDGVRPYMTIAKDRFPDPNNLTKTMDFSGKSWTPAKETAFMGQWATDKKDWTSYSYDSTHSVRYPEYIHSMAMGQPLEPGTYYIAVSAGEKESTDFLSYTLESRLVGAGLSYEPHSIVFDGGSAAISNLTPRSVAYYAVTVPPNTKSWKVWLENITGETSLYIREDYIPTKGQDGKGYNSPGLEIDKLVHLEKEGDEHYVLLPEKDETFIPDGLYYLMVVSDGENPDPSSSSIGTNRSQAILYSLGEGNITDLGTLAKDGVAEWSLTADTGEVHRVQFELPDGVLGVEVRLLNPQGEVNMKLRTNALFSAMDKGGYGGLFSGDKPDYKEDSTISISSPRPGLYSLLISDPAAAKNLVSGNRTLQISTFEATPIIFNGGNGGSDILGSLGPKTWHYYKVTVPDGASVNSLLGWEVRMTSWSGTRPYLVIRRDELPDGTSTTGGKNSWGTQTSVTKGDGWTSGSQWATDKLDWTGTIYDATHSQQYPSYLLSMAFDRPLEGGTYYIGVYNKSSSEDCEYHFTTAGIGLDQTYEVGEVDFDGGTNLVTNLEPRISSYFKVDVPEGVSSWKLHLKNTHGETALFARKGYIPTWGAIYSAFESATKSTDKMAGMRKTGDEYYVLLPETGEATLRPGTYYLMVVGQGELAHGSSNIGEGTSSAIIESLGEAELRLFDAPLGDSVTMLTDTNALAAGEVELYQFSLTNNVPAFEVRLVDLIGNLSVTLRAGDALPKGSGSSSRYGGLYSPNTDGENGTLITVPNPSATTWSLVVSSPDKIADVAPASYRLEIRALPTPELNFDPSQNATGGTNVATGSLIDEQRDFYKIVVPESVEGEPVLAWSLRTDVTQGKAGVRVFKDFLPEDSPDQMGFVSPSAVITDPLLSPGTWYVEVKGDGDTIYTLTSSALTPLRTFSMPEKDEAITDSIFGDTGVDENGLPLPDDQGIDLDAGNYQLYVVNIPTNNAGLFRTQLQAISGNPDLYIRKYFIPTLDHDNKGSGEMVDHRLDSNINTEYGSWVPLDSRYENELPAGKWYLLVRASGISNARYRLTLGSGNPLLNGLVQDLSFTQGAFANQTLVENDWRYYRVEVPERPSRNWEISFSQISGDVDLYIRDTVPPGNFEEFSNRARDLKEWASDKKSGSYEEDAFQDQGTYSIGVSPLRPGKVYYLGFLAKSDATFSVSVSTNGSLIETYPSLDFENGTFTTNLPPHAQLTYQIDVPEDAVRWIHTATNAAEVSFFIRQGLPPLNNGEPDWSSEDTENSSLNKLVASGANWPWISAERYYLTITNTDDSVTQPVSFNLKGTRTPEVPTGVSASDGTASSYISISWHGITGATKYDVWRSTSSNKTSAVRVVEGLASRSFTDRTPAVGVLNYYWISLSSVSTTNILEWFSQPDSGWMPGTGTGLSETSASFDYKGSGTNSTTVSVSADASTYWKVTKKPSWITIVFSDNGPGNGIVKYAVQMHAGETERSGEIIIAGQSYSVHQTAYGLVNNVQASDGTIPQGISITWDSKEDAMRYYIFRSESDNVETAVQIISVTGTAFDDTSVLLGHTYYYWIQPYNAGGRGGLGTSDSGYKKIAVSDDWKNINYPGGYPGDDSDTDGDGYTAIDEYLAGTDPNDADSFFKIKMIKEDSTLKFVINPALEKRLYTFYYKSSLHETEWIQLGDGIVGTNGPIYILVPTNDDKSFFIQTVDPAPE